MKKFISGRLFQTIFALLIGVICVYYVAGSFDWNQIWISVKKVNYIIFFISISATLIVCFLVRTLRWHLLLKDENIEIPFIKLYLYNAFAIGISTITPFQSGEALKVELLRKYGGKRLSGYAIFFLERVFDLSTVLSLAIVGSIFGLEFGIKRIYLYIVGAGFIIILATAIGCIALIPIEILKPIRDWLNGIWQKKWNLLSALGLTFISWIIIVLGWKLALSFFSIDISFLHSVSLVSLTTLISVISFVPGAVGVSELSISTLLINMDINNLVAQTGAIAIRCYAIVILIMTVIHWAILKFVKK